MKPVAPDWSQVDSMGNYIHQMYDEEPVEDILLFDFRFEDLQLTEEQLHMARPGQARKS